MRQLSLSLILLLAGAAGCTRSNLTIDGDGGDCLSCQGDLSRVHDGSTNTDGPHLGGDLGDHLHDMSEPPDMTRRPPPPDGGMVCEPTCGACQGRGACCGNRCCGAGEWCDANQQCRCGTGKACSQGDTCTTAGPIQPGGGRCGGICCGVTGPCPL